MSQAIKNYINWFMSQFNNMHKSCYYLMGFWIGFSSSLSHGISNQSYLSAQDQILSPHCAMAHYLRTENQDLALIEFEELSKNFKIFVAQYQHQKQSPLSDYSVTQFTAFMDDIAKTYDHAYEQAKLGELQEARSTLEQAEKTWADIRKKAHLFSRSDGLHLVQNRLDDIFPFFKKAPDLTDPIQLSDFSYKLGAYATALDLFLNSVEPQQRKAEEFVWLEEILTRTLASYQDSLKTQNNQMIPNITGELWSTIRIAHYQFC